jgi:MFS family permease
MKEGHPKLRDQLRSLPKQSWILFGGTLINRFGTFVLIFLVLYVTEKGYSAGQAGITVGAYGAGHLISSTLGGYLADTIGRRMTIVISMFGSAATMLALSQADAIVLITVLAGLAGVMAELYRPASFAMTTDLVPPESRVIGFAAYRLAVNAGFAFGPAVAGLLAERSFTLLFVGDAITSVLFAIVALIWLPESRKTDREEEPGGYIDALRDRVFIRFLIASLLAAMVYFQFETTLALHVRDAGMSPAAYGALLSLNGIVIVFLELPITSWTQRLPAPAVMAAGMVLVGVGFGLTAFAAALPMLILTVIIWTFGEILNAPVATAYAAGRAPPHLRGRYTGLTSFTWGAGFALGPMLGTGVYSIEPNLLWGACALTAWIGGALAFSLPREQVDVGPARPPVAPEIPGIED